ncbi:bifunctional diguanylate cyclase/phosphodiesterase [Roseateles violae]|uniref:EAL domain-containing protein n=1 Tax=Roseateles violae TaxID=3058042 RepID=A0ABT8DZ99_9BURK|nr:EAL domain-containing protein [Pelomonas sp. PFR6]MDN3922922.1 EAL domain-containing protein [Pelomonas sp. PFR6]
MLNLPVQEPTSARRTERSNGPRPAVYSEPSSEARTSGLALLTVATAALLAFAQSLPLSELRPPLLASLHVLVKMVGAAIALAISLLTWNTRRAQPLNFVIAGFGFFAVAVLAAMQLVMAPGMPGLAAAHDANAATVMLLSTDGAAIAALLAAALGPAHPGSPRALRAGIAVTGIWIAASIALARAALQWGPGTEQAAAYAELALAATALVAAGLLFLRHLRGAAAFALLAMAALLLAIGVAGGSGMPPLQHAGGIFSDGYKVLAGLLVYLALFRKGVLLPWHQLVESGRAVEVDRRRYKQLFESAPDGLLLVDGSGRILHANPAAAAMFGWASGELTGQRVEVLLPAALRHEHERARTRFDVSPQARQMGRGGSLTAARRDGGSFPVEIALVPQEFGDGHSTLCIVRDVTERRQLEETLMRQALHDALTELPNRRHFRDSVTKALAHAERHGGTLALVFIDLDNFKQVNDSFGHSEGDALLCQVARRLAQTLRGGDLLARMGGDEFAVLLVGAQQADAAAVAGKVLRVLEPDFAHGGQAFKVGASIGITMYPTDGRSVEELLSNADLAMYRAKHRGRNTWCFFEQRMTERLRERSSLQRELAHATKRGQFELAFQPRVHASDGALSGYEALLRWRHPLHGNVPPDVFISLAEESGLIVSIGEWVLREACAQAARWRAAGAADLTMAVNVSPHQLRHAGFAACVQQVLLETGWPARQLELEITETALMEDPREVAVLLHRINALGVRFAIDDFGTGYSSLAYLKTFPLHRLKVDRSFVQGLQVEGSDRVIAASIIALAHALGLEVTAEGVETADQRDFLREQRCDELQGYLFSAPISAAQCEAWLTQKGIPCRQSLTPHCLQATYVCE